VADLTIIHAYVVTMDAQRRIIDDGAIAISGNRIVAVDKTARLLEQPAGAHVIDAGGMMALPGLIDAHMHPNEYLANGIADDVDITSGLYDYIYPYEAALTPEEAYVSGLGAYVEAIKSGTTCFSDPGGTHVDALAQAAVDVGIRGIINRSTRDLDDPTRPIPATLTEATEICLREGEAVVKRWNGAAGGRLKAWFSLRYVFNISEELARGIKTLADRHQVGIHVHAACIHGENEAMRERFGKTALERFYDLGLFGPNLHLVHMGYPEAADVTRLKRHDVKTCHCPTASMLGGYGVIQHKMIPRLLDAGITVSLGTDSATAGGHLDMIRVMNAAACAHKDAFADATVMGAHKALEMATLHGARACLWEDALGSLEPNKFADVVLVRMDGLDWHPARDPVRSLVYTATGQNVDTVIIDGRVVMRRRVVLTVDEEHLKHRVQQASRAWRERASFARRSPWPVV
jgi:cytosine/adenosine deaminase-related metal-dependent hydrolase